jgi:hypothetical protein
VIAASICSLASASTVSPSSLSWRSDELARLAIVLSVRLGVSDHVLDLLVGESGAGPDLDLLLLAGAEILGRHAEDPVRVDVECDLDLRDAARRRRDAGQLELAE